MIELFDVTKRFGDEIAVNGISLRVEKGELCALVGTSGCGKSTTLRMINRLIEHSEGEIHLDGQPVRTFNEEILRRRIGYVIQSTGLFPTGRWRAISVWCLGCSSGPGSESVLAWRN